MFRSHLLHQQSMLPDKTIAQFASVIRFTILIIRMCPIRKIPLKVIINRFEFGESFNEFILGLPWQPFFLKSSVNFFPVDLGALGLVSVGLRALEVIPGAG